MVVHPTTSAPVAGQAGLQHRAGAGAEPGQAAGRAPHLQPDGDLLAGRHLQPFPDPGRTARRRRLQAQVDRVRPGHPAAPGGQAAQDRPPVQPVGQDHGPGVADPVVVAVGVAAAHRRQVAAGGQQPVPAGQGGLVVRRPGAVPDLDGVHAAVAEAPGAAGERVAGVGGHGQPAPAVQLGQDPVKGAVGGPVAPVDHGPGGQAEGQPVAVAGGDLLAVDHEEVRPGVAAPAEAGAGRVVLGGGDEVEPGRAGRGGQLGRGARAVGVDGVGVQVAPVPAAAPAARPRGRRVGDERRPRRPPAQGHLGPPGQPLGGDGVGAEHELPGARVHRAGQVPRGRARRRDGEAVAGPARPPPEPGVHAPLVEHPDVEGVAGHARRGRRPVVAVADGQLAHAAAAPRPAGRPSRARRAG